MDARGNIYTDAPESIPAEDKARLHKQIREWYATLQAGGSITGAPYPEGTSLALATVRALNGLGPDQTDPNGEQAMAEVQAALADRPAPDP